MSIRPANITLSAAFALMSFAFFTASALGQATTSPPISTDSGIASGQNFRLGNPASKIPFPKATPIATDYKPVAASTPSPDDVQSEIAAVKAENAAVRDMLRKMAEQQKVLLEQVDRLQKRLDGNTTSTTTTATTTAAQATGQSQGPPPTDAPPFATDSSGDLGAPKAILGSIPGGNPPAKKQAAPERYQDGIILWATPDEAKVPFMLKFNIVTQFRYLNTLDSDTSFTDHLGVLRDIHRRNDVTVNRSMFTFSGYIWDKRLQYSLLVWTAAGAASIIVAGSIGWRFNRHLTLTGGYLGIPGSRSLTNTFPYFTSTDRTMADNFFRPGFTQGVMASGEITKNLYYNAFLGNSLNTLSITANKIDTNLMGAGSVWWEPLGGYSEPGRSVNMYDDYFAQKKLRIRLGTSFTVSREDRFSNLDTSSPENTGVYNSDGVNAFQTGAFAIGVTVQNATYKMWATDWGFKYNGLAINGQYYARWLNDFNADGPLPLTSTFDHGYEISVGKFVVPKKLMIYGRGSGIFGQFKDPYEYGAGVKWHFLNTERLWLNFELMKVKGSAYSGAFSPYTSGMNGWVPMIQSVIAF